MGQVGGRLRPLFFALSRLAVLPLGLMHTVRLVIGFRGDLASIRGREPSNGTSAIWLRTAKHPNSKFQIVWVCGCGLTSSMAAAMFALRWPCVGVTRYEGPLSGLRFAPQAPPRSSESEGAQCSRPQIASKRHIQPARAQAVARAAAALLALLLRGPLAAGGMAALAEERPEPLLRSLLGRSPCCAGGRAVGRSV